MRYPTVQPPAGYRVVPEAAANFPRVSKDGTTYTFTVRKGFRFADGSPLTARNFAYAIERLRKPSLESPFTRYVQEIVSARATRLHRLVIRLRKPVGDLLARLATPFFCPIPLSAGVDREGLRPPFSGAGPYTIASYEPGRQLIAVRNPYYPRRPPAARRSLRRDVRP